MFHAWITIPGPALRPVRVDAFRNWIGSLDALYSIFNIQTYDVPGIIESKAEAIYSEYSDAKGDLAWGKYCETVVFPHIDSLIATPGNGISSVIDAARHLLRNRPETRCYMWVWAYRHTQMHDFPSEHSRISIGSLGYRRKDGTIYWALG